MEIWWLLSQAALTFLVIIIACFYIDYTRRLQHFADKSRCCHRHLKGRRGRPLEALETLAEFKQRNGATLFSVTFFVKSKRPLKEEALLAALKNIAADNPMLRMKIKRSSEDFLYFEEMESFRPNVEIMETDDWRRVVETDLTKPFNSSVGPLWRVKMLRGGGNGQEQTRPLILTFHHAIVDGISAVNIGDRLMDELSGENLSGWRTPFAGKLPPSYVSFLGERLTDISRLWKIIIYLTSKLFQVINFFPKEKPCSFVARAASPKQVASISAVRQTSFIPLKLNKDDFDKLLGQCRRHNCKLQGALQAVVSLAQVETLQRLKVEGSKLPDLLNIQSRYPESAREIVEPNLPSSVIGCYITGRMMRRNVESDTERQRENFWTLAKSMSDEIRRKKQETPVEFFLKRLEFIFRIFPGFLVENIQRINERTFLRESINLDFVISNFGKFLDREDERAFDISAAYSAHNATFSEVCFLHMILSLRGQLFWSINFSEVVISAEEGRVNARCLEEVLRDVVNGRI